MSKMKAMRFIRKYVLNQFLVVTVCLCLIVPAGCDYFALRTENTLLAKAYNNRLYLEDIRQIIPDGTNPEDSAAIVNRYVDRWIDQQVFLYHAKQALPSEKLDFEQLVKDYRNTLIIHAFESDLTRKEMDSTVTDQDINRYYEENHMHFSLRDHIVQGNYIKLPLNVSALTTIRSLYRTADEEGLNRLEDHCLDHAATYYIARDNWIAFNDILLDMPLEIDDKRGFLRNNRHAEITDDYYRYFLYIHDYRLKGDISPLEFERDNIRMQILNRRKQAFIRKKRLEFFNQAIEANRIEIYY